MKNTSNIIIPFRDNTEFVSNYIFPIILKDSTSEYRDEIRNKLHENGIQTSIHYPAVHKFSIYKNESSVLEITDYIVSNEITLPMYGALTKEDVNFITKTVKQLVSE